MSDNPNSHHGDSGEPAKHDSQPEQYDGQNIAQKFRPFKFIADKFGNAKRNYRAAEKYQELKNAIKIRWLATVPHLRRAYISTEHALETGGTSVSNWIDATLESVRTGIAKVFTYLTFHNRAILLATIAMATTSGLQWKAITRTNEQMERQRTAMVDQNTIMREQMGQTDKQIGLAQGQLQQMRLEQRAWLGIVQPQIGELVPDKKIDCKVPVKNSGRTPGNIDRAVAAAFAAPKSANIDKAMVAVDELTQVNPKETVVPPDATTVFYVSDTVTLTKDQIAKVTTGDLEIWIVGRIEYRDTLNKKRITQFCFKYDPGAKLPIGHEKHNYMN